MAIKLRKPIKIDPIDVAEKTAVGIRLPFNKKKVFLKDGGIAGHKLFVTVNYSLVNNDEEDSVTLSFTNDNFNNQ